ncbi:MAG: RdgB/HAM1 family non-canonical purine NTP pyrophosphatase [Rhizomicrobium sp.]
MTLRAGETLVVASHNQGKVREIRELLTPFRLHVVGANELGLDEPEEIEADFAGNAVLKARAAANATNHIALADDSGLTVRALGGAPGIYSARWAGPNRNFEDAMRRVEQELREKGATDLSAKFVCALALAAPHDDVEVFEGEVHGTLVFPPRGTHGFGYDPIFVAEGMTQTFGEIEPATKHGMSHRARAFEKLVKSAVFTP